MATALLVMVVGVSLPFYGVLRRIAGAAVKLFPVADCKLFWRAI